MTPRALVLCAGRGERMRPLSDACPKPLLPVRGKPLVVWHLEALAAAGVREVVINTAWLEDQFPRALGDGGRFGLDIRYSMEGRDHGGALETAGGIATALRWLAPGGDEPFWVVSGDIHMPDFRFDAALAAGFAGADDDAWLWLVPNPPFHPDGDFALDADGRLRRPDSAAPAAAGRPYTYANVALMRPRLVAGVAPGTRAPLGRLLFDSARAGRLRGLPWAGRWHNIGTPAQLRAVDAGHEAA